MDCLEILKTISNNTITYCQKGITTAGATIATISSNDISLSFLTASNTAVTLSANDVFKYNWVHDFTNSGGDDGVSVGGAGCSLYYNIFSVLPDLGVDVYQSDNTLIYNNSFYDVDDQGIRFSGTSVGNIIKNNIISGGNNDMIFAASTDSGTGSNNIFVNDAGASGSGEYTGTDDLAATDPLFTDAANNDYILLPASPAIGKAYGWSQTRDYSNNSKSGSLWDIGALEYQSEGNTVRYKMYIGFPKFPKH